MIRSNALVALFAIVAMLVFAPAGRAQDPLVNELKASADFASAIQASDAPPAASASTVSLQANADRLTHEYRMHQDTIKIYEVLVLSALVLVSLFVVLRFLTVRGGDSRLHVVNATGLIFIVFGTILLGILADTDQHLTATVGILGAVAGYLFRSMRPAESDRDSTDKTS